MMFSGIGLRIALIAFVLAAAFFGGYRVANNACKAAEAHRLQVEIEARKVDESFTQGVSSAYEQVAAQLRRLSAVNRTEVIRETQKVEYRCPLLPDGERLRIDGIRAANAAAGQPDQPLPANPTDPGKGSGRTADSLFGTDGDVR